MKRSIKKNFYFGYWFVILFAVGFHILFNNLNPFLFNPISQKNNIVFSIKEGENTKEIIRKLYQEKIIPSSVWFIAYLYYHKWTYELKFGRYIIRSTDTPAMIARKFYDGSVGVNKITIIEGWKFSDLKKRILNSPNMEYTIINEEEEVISQKLGIPKKFLDGAFMPDTYLYEDGESDLRILRKAQHSMMDFHEKHIQNASPEIKKRLDNVYKVLSLAAIIEKETANNDEYGIISSVFHNRLKKNMRLQADPTVIYAIGDQYKGRIRTRHLRFKSPYNTYTVKGVPPYPIAFAGKKSILATLNPLQTNYLYFVAKGNGRDHYFNDNLPDHDKAVQKYVELLRERKRKRKKK